jgi:acetyl esterase/lipase
MAAIDTRDVAVEKDVVFGRGGDRELLCDVYRPPSGQTKRTAVVHIHGGAFRGGSKEGARTAGPLAALGYVGVAMQYRLSQEAKWPAQIQDVKACIRWTRANADELGIDPDKIVVAGYSAGAHLALVAAGSQNQAPFEGEGGNAGVGTGLGACIAFYAPSIVRRPADGGEHVLLGSNTGVEAYRSINPISYVAPGYPPTILLHGTADQSVPVEFSVRLYQAMMDARVPVELHIVEGVTHIFDAHREFAELSAEWIDLFLDRHVVNPRIYPSTEPGQR